MSTLGNTPGAQRLVFENGELFIRVEANCSDLTFAEIVLAIMETIGRPRVSLEKC